MPVELLQIEKIKDPTNIVFSIYISKKNVKFLVHGIRFLAYIKSKYRGQMVKIGAVALCLTAEELENIRKNGLKPAML